MSVQLPHSVSFDTWGERLLITAGWGWEFRPPLIPFFSGRGRSTSLLLFIHWQCGEAGLADPGSYGCPGPHLAFSDTSPTEASGHLISARWGWKSRLSIQPLLVVGEWGHRFFSVVCGWSSVVIVWRFSILGGCPFSVPLPKQRRRTAAWVTQLKCNADHSVLPRKGSQWCFISCRRKASVLEWPRGPWVGVPPSSRWPCLPWIPHAHSTLGKPPPLSLLGNIARASLPLSQWWFCLPRDILPRLEIFLSQRGRDAIGI